jgi:hypothetical protein
MSASVLIAGVTDTPVMVETKPDSDIEAVIAQAAKELDVDLEAVSRLVPIVNGQTVDKGTIVPENAVITASPLVSNG